jgi:polyphosphate kinase 2
MKAQELTLTPEDVELLNSPIGQRLLFAEKKLDLPGVLKQVRYETRLKDLQVELVHLQTWVIKRHERVCVLFEGRDAAGKGGAIRRIAARINQRHYRVVALDKPTPDEAGQWYLQRYINRLPRPGEMVFFDRSWYNRAVVEPVNRFCTDEQYEVFMGQVNHFERMLIESGIRLVKFYFSITKDEQARRFEEIHNDPRKRWKITPVDMRAQELWDDYTRYKERMFEVTDTEFCPWTVIDANSKRTARLEAIERLLKVIPYLR